MTLCARVLLRSCDGHAPTITVIRGPTGRVCGSFQVAPFRSGDWQYIAPTGEEFLFFSTVDAPDQWDLCRVRKGAMHVLWIAGIKFPYFTNDLFIYPFNAFRGISLLGNNDSTCGFTHLRADKSNSLLMGAEEFAIEQWIVLTLVQ